MSTIDCITKKNMCPHNFIREVSLLFQRLICTQKYTIGTSETVLVRDEVSLFQRRPLIKGGSTVCACTYGKWLIIEIWLQINLFSSVVQPLLMLFFFFFPLCCVQGIYTLTDLQELSLSENSILFLSPNISRLVSLTTLNLSKNSE